MNLLIAWNLNMGLSSFEGLVRSLGVSHLYELNFRNKTDFVMKDVEYTNIDGNAPFATFERLSDDLIPLDQEILEKMQPYERMAFEIINRWKRSLTTNFEFFELRHIYNVYLRYWNDFIIKNNINCFIVDADPHAPLTYIPYVLCKIHGIPTIHSHLLPAIYGELMSKIYVSELEDPWSVYPEVYKNLVRIYRDVPEEDITLEKSLEKYIKAYSNQEKDITNTVIGIKIKNKLKDKIAQYFGRGFVYLKTKRYRILGKKILYSFKVKPQSKQLLKYVEGLETDPNIGEDYVFFPLHYQPEAATLPRGGYFTDMILIIDMISNNLPEGTKLYVKEHPVYWDFQDQIYSMLEARSKEYYKRILRNSNVALIRHEYPSLKLIRHSKALITLNGTAGMEALFSQVPIIMFGNTFYMFASGVYKIKTNRECKDALTKAVNGELHAASSKEAKLFLKTFEGYIGEKSFGDLPEQKYEGFPIRSEDEDSKSCINALINYIKVYAPEIIKEKLNDNKNYKETTPLS